MGSGSTTKMSTKHISPFNEDGDNKVSGHEIRKVIGNTNNSSIKRFTQIHTIGLGGIGTVLSAYEENLDRDIAIKMLRPPYRENRNSIDRFIQEARATAHIAHPNIVPVYELGVFEDTGPFFTMKRVEGVTLQHILKRLNENPEKYAKKYTLRNLLNIFISVCNGVACAHSKNIIHRDLKPANIMLGDYGEVMVMDWGLVKRADHAEINDRESSASQPKNETDTMKTLDGEVTGTPAYMSPEQACGDNYAVDTQSDIYSLGAILYSILTRQRSPFPRGLKTQEILQLNAEGIVIPPRKRAPKLKIPPELDAITMKAMSRKKTDRYATVLDLIRDVRNYLDNYPVEAYPEPLYISFFKACRRRPLIPTTVAGAITALIIAFGFQIYDRNAHFNHYIKQANENILSGDMMYARGKTAQKRLDSLSQSAEYDIEREKKIEILSKQLDRFGASLNNYYNVAENYLSKIESKGSLSSLASSRLGYIMKNRIYYSLFTNDFQTTRRLVELMRLNRRPASYMMIRENAILYKKMNLVFYNEGMFSLNSTPASRIEITDLSQKTAEKQTPEVRSLGMTPIKDIIIPAGSYLITMSGKNKTSIRYPLKIEVGDMLDKKVDIPEEIPDKMIYIPGGTYYSGEAAVHMRKKYLAGYFIKKAEVTIGEYLEFWKTIRNPEQKKNYRSMLLLDSKSRCLEPAWDDNAKLYSGLKPEYPVCGISHKAALAYCRWLSVKQQQPCRLPTAAQWEKAARGVDGRIYPWGSKLPAAGILIPENRSAVEKYPFGAPTAAFAKDISVYGVMGMAGGVREYTASINHGSNNIIVKGGSSRIGGNSARCGFNGFAGRLADDIGFRYIIPVIKHPKKKKK